MEYEQPLLIHERNGGLSCQRDANTHVTDMALQVRWGVTTRRHGVKRVQCRYRITNNRYQSANVTLDVVTARDAQRRKNKKATLLKVTQFTEMLYIFVMKN